MDVLRGQLISFPLELIDIPIRRFGRMRVLPAVTRRDRGHPTDLRTDGWL